MITKILVPSDGSETARKAALYACDLAGMCQAELEVYSKVGDGKFEGVSY